VSCGFVPNRFSERNTKRGPGSHLRRRERPGL
jgi:hypothetical protein